MENTNKKTQVYNLIILDKSGSMSSIANAAISGFNETVGSIRSAQERFKDTQEHFVSLMIFCNCEKTMVYDMVPVDKVKELTRREYNPCCCTPLYDAMGKTLNELEGLIHPEDKVMATVITDGMENASHEYSGKTIKALVARLREKGWVLAYIGANQDAVEVARDLNIGNALNFDATPEGTAILACRLGRASRRMSKKAMFNFDLSKCETLFDEMDED